jgi:hypothetical protein
LRPGKPLQLSQSSGERIGCHVVGIGPKSLHPPAAVRRPGARPTPAAERLAELLECDPVDAEGRRQRGGIELRISARAGVPPDVCDGADLVPAQQRQKGAEVVGRVPDRVDFLALRGRD